MITDARFDVKSKIPVLLPTVIEDVYVAPLISIPKVPESVGDIFPEKEIEKVSKVNWFLLSHCIVYGLIPPLIVPSSLIVGPSGLGVEDAQSWTPVISAFADSPDTASLTIIIGIETSGKHPDSSVTATVNVSAKGKLLTTISWPGLIEVLNI